MPSHALIATHHLVEYAGSEVFTLELAVSLRRLGWQVKVASFLADAPMRLEFENHGFKILDLIDEIDQLQTMVFDLVWLQHGPVVYHLLATHQVPARRVFVCSHSHFEPLEQVPVGLPRHVQVLAHSTENQAFIARQLNCAPDRIRLFPNCAGREYWEQAKTTYRNSPLQRILLISNHPPAEVLASVELLREAGIHIEHIGLGGHSTLVTPQLLLPFDAIISIGKSVIYGIALRIPVYCYDRFGGPGWISPENYQGSADYNHSGRGTAQKFARQIADEIRRGYPTALAGVHALHEQAAPHLRLERQIELLLAVPAQPSVVGVRWEIPVNEQLQQNQYIRLLRTHRGLNEAHILRTDQLNAELMRVKSTFSWRITAPLRASSSFMRRITSLLK